MTILCMNEKTLTKEFFCNISLFEWNIRKMFYSFLFFLNLFLFFPFILKSAYVSFKNTLSGGFPCDPVVNNLPDHTGESFDPWSKNIPHATGRLSQLATATQATCRSCELLCVLDRTVSPRSAGGAATAVRSLRTTPGGSPCPLRLEKARAQQRRLSAVRKVISFRCTYLKSDTSVLLCRRSQTKKDEGVRAQYSSKA